MSIHRIFLICEREFSTRVKKKSFLWMTLLTPLLITLLYGTIIYININKELGEQPKHIRIEDTKDLLSSKLSNEPLLQITWSDQLTTNWSATDWTNLDGVLQVPEHTDSPFVFVSKSATGLFFIQKLENRIEQILKSNLMYRLQMDTSHVRMLNETRANITVLELSDEGTQKSGTGVATALAFGGSILIYFFIFLYGVQVMRGVIEEKSSRIVEVILSSVKPFELMLGKIIGIVSVGLVQFALWVVLIILLSTAASGILSDLFQGSPVSQSVQVQETINSSFEWSATLQSKIYTALAGFLFYFITGYLLYASLFAVIGSAVDNETDTQQFILPVTLPLILSVVFAQNIILSDPHSTLAVWLSMIPFTSPIVMMCRLPFGVPTWQLIISATTILVTIIIVIGLAARVYRTGILMYGKKASIKELTKWLFYRH